MLVMVVFWFSFHLYKKAKRQRRTFQDYYKPRIIMSIVLICFYLYPAISNVIISLFAFVDLDAPTGDPASDAALMATGRHWTQDTLQPFFKGPHLVLVLVLGIPGLLFYSIGFPVAMAIVMRRNKNKLWVDKNVSDEIGICAGSGIC
jgi:hypothetical protein